MFFQRQIVWIRKKIQQLVRSTNLRGKLQRVNWKTEKQTWDERTHKLTHEKFKQINSLRVTATHIWYVRLSNGEKLLWKWTETFFINEQKERERGKKWMVCMCVFLFKFFYRSPSRCRKQIQRKQNKKRKEKKRNLTTTLLNERTCMLIKCD